ncbi:MAG: cytochrome c biogenesis protein ResB, partial [Deltaproteobacteria bacterium]|nr:cytochrome c biogenesis protein ResB [Deltaproteobacteria bacterium]
EPLEFEGYTFYQASYQPLDGKKFVNLRIGPHGGKLESYQVEQGDLKNISPGNIQVTELYEDYAGLGPAVQVKQADAQFVVFRKYPDFDAQVRRGEWDVVFSGFDEPYATGVSVGKVPGLWAVFAGFIIMFMGLYMAFGMSQRRYYARITRLANSQFELCLAGVSHRYPQAFEKEFLNLVNQYRSL